MIHLIVPESGSAENLCEAPGGSYILTLASMRRAGIHAAVNCEACRTIAARMLEGKTLVEARATDWEENARG